MLPKENFTIAMTYIARRRDEPEHVAGKSLLHAWARTHMITVEKLEHNKSDGWATEVLFEYLCIHLNPCMLEWFDIKFSLNSKVHPPQAPRARITI